MSYDADSSIDARVRAVEKEYMTRQNRLFITFAVIEGPVLIVLAVLIFAFEIIEPDIGVWILIVAALIGGFLLSMMLLRLLQARAAAVAQARGENPLF